MYREGRRREASKCKQTEREREKRREEQSRASVMGVGPVRFHSQDLIDGM